MKKIYKFIIAKKHLSLIILIFILSVLLLTLQAVKKHQDIRKEASERISSVIEKEESRDFVKIIPLDIDKPIFSYKVSGKVSLSEDNSFLRLVLIGKNDQEFLIYEAYPLINEKGAYSISDSCEETCLLDSIVPQSLRIEGKNASFILTETHFVANLNEVNNSLSVENILIEQQKIKREADQVKIRILNNRNLKWTAGETPLSEMTYAQKKQLFSGSKDYLPYLGGFEYYKGGIFEMPSSQEKISSASDPYPVKWDWRDRHGENWMTSVKNQLPYTTCWAFANVGGLEALINLYSNKHLDLDLSEQYLISCDSSGVETIDEQCFPYQGPFDECSNQCSDWQNRLWASNNFTQILDMNSFSDLKAKIITYGPIYLHYNLWHHALVIVGYGKDDTMGDYIIVKNSFSDLWGDNGYAMLTVDKGFISNNGFYVHDLPVYQQEQILSEVSCVDKDGDGYCNWGISKNKPSTCLNYCKAEKDCDDSDPNALAFDENYNCTYLLQPTPTPCRVPDVPIPVSLGSASGGIVSVSQPIKFEIIPQNQRCADKQVEYYYQHNLEGGISLGGPCNWTTDSFCQIVYNQAGTRFWRVKSRIYDSYYQTFRESNFSNLWEIKIQPQQTYCSSDTDCIMNYGCLNTGTCVSGVCNFPDKQERYNTEGQACYINQGKGNCIQGMCLLGPPR